MNFTSYLNHSINSVLYCIVGTRFRLEMCKILCRKKTSSEGISSSQSLDNTNLTTISWGRSWLVWNLFSYCCDFHHLCSIHPFSFKWRRGYTAMNGKVLRFSRFLISGTSAAWTKWKLSFQKYEKHEIVITTGLV